MVPWPQELCKFFLFKQRNTTFIRYTVPLINDMQTIDIVPGLTVLSESEPWLTLQRAHWKSLRVWADEPRALCVLMCMVVTRGPAGL